MKRFSSIVSYAVPAVHVDGVEMMSPDKGHSAMRICLFAIGVLLFVLASPSVLAKHKAPASVDPIIHQGVRYVLPNDKGLHAYVEAWDAQTERKLWTKTVFRRWFCPFRGTECMQYEYINSMVLQTDQLLLTSERGREFTLDIRTHAVRRVRTKWPTGCATSGSQPRTVSVSSEIVINLQRGISENDLQATLDIPPTHEFTAWTPTNAIRCVSYCFRKPQLKYYFMFFDGTLVKVCEPPPFEYGFVPYKGAKLSVRKPWTPEDRMLAVLKSPDLTREAFELSLTQRDVATVSSAKNVLPAFVIVAPAWVATAPIRVLGRLEVKSLANTFAPDKLRLGMQASEVEKRFGQPKARDKLDDGREIRYYGSPKLGVNPLLWVSVVFEDARVIRIFSDDFFDTDKIANRL
jgi:hypothetical protein